MQAKWSQAFKKMADGFPALPNDPSVKGLPALCSVMGWPFETARKEIAGEYAKLGFNQAMDAMLVCEAAGGTDCFALRDLIDSARPDKHVRRTEMSMDDRVAHAMKELADVAIANAEAARDNSYSDNDLHKLRKEIMEAVSAVVAIGEGAEAEHAKATNLRAVK
jgi:hypothetical protein